MKPFLLALCLIVALGGCHRKKSKAPAATPTSTAPSLGLKSSEIKFSDFVKGTEFLVRGRGCAKLEVALWHISAESAHPQTTHTFEKLPDSFEGKLWLLAQGGDSFGKKDQKVYILGESIPAGSKTQSSREPDVFQGPYTIVGQQSVTQDSYEAAREHVVLACCMSKQTNGHSFGVDTLENLKKHAAETKDEIMAVTIRWEP